MLGMGVMLEMLSGNEDTVSNVQNALKENRVIDTVRLENDVIILGFADGSRLELWDGCQSCCESRYTTTDDQLDQFGGAHLTDIEIRPAPDRTSKYGNHECQFLVLITDRGNITFETHNEHNGYYGGFWIKAKFYPVERVEV